MTGRSVHLTTLFPGQAWTSGWPILHAHTFACNWQKPFLNDSAEGRRMTVGMISWSTSKKVWDWAGIKLATSGTAVRHASVVRHAALSTALRGPVYLSVNHFGSRSAPTQCRAWYGSKRFGNAISTCKSPLVRKKLNSICIVCIHMNRLWLFGLHMHRMHAHQSSGVRARLYFVLIGQQRQWRNYIDGRLVLAFAVRIYMW